MNKIFSGKYFLYLQIAFFLTLFFVTRNDPFFGDAIASTSGCVNTIYDQNLGTFFYPVDADPAHPTLYSWFMALSWKIFGRTLYISHLYGIIWLMVLVSVFRKIAKIFLYDIESVNKATLLLFVMPVFLAQGAMMLNTVAVMTFFLAAIYGLIKKNKAGFLIGSTLMMIAHLQGAFFLLALASADLFFALKEKKSLLQFVKERFLFYFIPLLVFGIWLFLHYRHTGWLIQSPNYTDADEWNSPVQFIKSVFIMIWRLIDFGMLPFYMIFIFIFFKNTGDKKLQQLWLILTVVICSFMAVFLSKTIGHRYFLALGMLMIIIVMNALRYFKTNQKNLLFYILLTSLTAGNFLYYPGKNIGDGTLAYRNYFPIEKQIKKDFGNSAFFYSYTPIANPSELMYLDDSGLKTKRIDRQELDSLPAIIQSNLNAEFSEDDKQFLEKNFYGKSYENGVVYVNVFLNPKYYSKPEGWKLREPSQFEKWMIGVKAKLKN